MESRRRLIRRQSMPVIWSGGDHARAWTAAHHVAGRQDAADRHRCGYAEAPFPLRFAAAARCTELARLLLRTMGTTGGRSRNWSGESQRPIGESRHEDDASW